MKELEDENTKLKLLIANLSLENHALKGLIGKISGAGRVGVARAVPDSRNMAMRASQTTAGTSR